MPKYLVEIAPNSVVVSIVNSDGTTRVLPKEGVRNLLRYLGRVLGVVAGSLIVCPAFEPVYSPVDGFILETKNEPGYGNFVKVNENTILAYDPEKRRTI